MKHTFLLSFIMFSLLFGDNDISKEKKLFDLSLEELMSIEVTTASQVKESILETPAIVSVITSKDLKACGAQNVYEALSFLPGIVINETYMGYTTVTFRGVSPGIFNTKALFMINSHPVYESLFGSAHIEYIPLEAIDRIEVVRSPASSLYGTQAISGVVNIITKQGQSNENEVVLRGGSNNHYYGSFTVHDTHLTMSGSMQKDKGYDFSGTNDEFGNPVSMDYKNDINNLFVDLYGEDWRVQGAYFIQKDTRYGMNPWVWLNGINDQESFYVDLYKSFEINSAKLELTLRYDNFDKVYSGAEFPFPAGVMPSLDYGQTDTSTTLLNRTQRYSGEIKYRDKISSDLSYIIGTSFEYDMSDPLIFVYDSDGSINPNGGFANKESSQNFAAFSQIKYKFSDKWNVILGLRIEDNSDNGASDLIPRLGITYKIGDQTYLKALYAEAFRTPSFLEKYAYVPGFLFGKEDLKREEMKTYELALDSRVNKNNTIQIALFYLELNNEILRIPSTGTALEYANNPGRKMYGVETSWLSILNDKSTLNLNASYINGEDKTLEFLAPNFNDDAPFVANYTFNAVFNYNFSSHWSGTISDQYISSKDYHLYDGTLGKIDGYNLTNLVLSYEKYPFKGMLTLKNIFDEEYTYPEPVRQVVSEIPGGAGATAYLTLYYYF